ncbi:ABC transporter permease [Sodalis ligni]|uniref:ABC transporter permease n=1 Tax=Sodalis ligni TaxID=2697027 RepID=UPI001BDE260E|nr:ABC transporter permease [Sodalis ligni]QWA13155.1 ABC transporter permease [Sodalis ligni]
MQRSRFSILATNPLAGVMVALVIIFVLSSLISPYFLSPYNMSVVARTLAFIGLITVGQSMLLILGELDLSLGVIGGLCGVIAGIFMVNFGIEPTVACVMALALGAVLGFLNGLLVTKLRLHSLVLTIGTAGIFGGANLVLTKGVAITGIPPSIQYFGRGDILGLPLPFVIMLAVVAVATFFTLKTPFGRYMYAPGNKRARSPGGGESKRSGCVFGVFSFAGFLAALAGILMVARLGTAQPSIGESWVLPPIAAAVIGGVATTGGVGTPFGAIIGATIIGIIENIIVLYGVSPYWQGIVSGVLVVVAISFDAVSRRYIRKEE